uniref:Uncharacterized protein n=1 Tax=Arundo donax TaxID=35708 RepID=A0A0A9FKM5_ARUDO
MKCQRRVLCNNATIAGLLKAVLLLPILFFFFRKAPK